MYYSLFCKVLALKTTTGQDKTFSRNDTIFCKYIFWFLQRLQIESSHSATCQQHEYLYKEYVHTYVNLCTVWGFGKNSLFCSLLTET